MVFNINCLFKHVYVVLNICETREMRNMIADRDRERHRHRERERETDRQTDRVGGGEGG